jgi:hypothetical protein
MSQPNGHSKRAKNKERRRMASGMKVENMKNNFLSAHEFV